MNSRCLLHSFHSVAETIAARVPKPSTSSSSTGRCSNYPELLRSCKHLSSLLQVHARLLVLGAASDDLIRTHLINSYSCFHKPDSALSIFDSSLNPGAILWNSMIRCYTKTAQHTRAIQFYRDMLERGIEPDKYTFTFVLKACAGAHDSENGKLVHQYIKRRGLLGDVFIGTGLIDMYSKLGMIETASELFESMPELDVVSWNAMIAGFSQSGNPHEALVLFRRIQSTDLVPDSVTILNLFPAICQLSALLLCRAVHGFIIRRCLVFSVSNGLIDTYSKCGRPEIARRIFDRMLINKDDVSWATMISGYVYNDCFVEALELFDELRRENIELNQVAVVSALSAATETRDLERGMDVHLYAIQRQMDVNVQVMTMLVTMYARCGNLRKAKLIFDGMKERDVVAWSAMISAFVQMGQPEEAMSLFQEMQLAGIGPNAVTIVGILPACADLLDLKLGKGIHGFVLRSNISLDVLVGTALLAMYAQCGNFTSAHALFNGLEHKAVITWNALINGYAQIGDADSALQMFHRLLATGQHPDPGTMTGVLSACAFLNALNKGEYIHCLVMKYGFESDLHVKNATIDMYAKCGDISSAEFLFFETSSTSDVISWNTMIAGYMHNGRASEAIATFHQMITENLKPTFVTFVSVLPAAAYMAALMEGMALHSYVIRTGYESHVLVGNSLIDMYSKCGRIDYARHFFDNMDCRDTGSWNSMLAGYAIHGLGKSAVGLFSQMRGSHIGADSVSFVCVLSACRHGGLIAEGRNIFNSMASEHHLEPKAEHYACMVDLLGRAGHVDEAWGLIQRMPMEPDASVWGALLGACRTYSNVLMGEMAVDHLVRLEPENPAHYVVLSNIYSQVGRWADAGKIRRAMNHTGLNKIPGCSWVDIKNTIHAFRVGDQSHPQYESMRNLWNDLHGKMEKMGYVSDTSSVLHNVEEEEKESFLNGHSERLAILLALLNTEPGMVIQVVKNLRVCGDCHRVTKLISKITNRRIIVRDSSRFHHFESGECSCKDYW